jgi:beta-lactamase class A
MKSFHLTRRQWLLAPSLFIALPSLARVADDLAALEQKAGGRLGAAVLDTGSGALAGHRAHERFGLNSTFKLLLAAAVLQRPDAGRRIAIRKDDLVPHSPVVKERLHEGSMTAAELAEATQKTSDNAAANLLLKHLFGGPEGFTAWLRLQGDGVTRLDRYELEMNVVPPGEERDTSTPSAIAATTARLLVGGGLKSAAAQRLIDWMEATRTGSRRLRAGFPSGWRAGDKTGTAMDSTMPDKVNDLAIVWPPGQAPWIVAAYYEGPQRNSPRLRPEDEAVLADVGRIVSAWRPWAR